MTLDSWIAPSLQPRWAGRELLPDSSNPLTRLVFVSDLFGFEGNAWKMMIAVCKNDKKF